MTENDIFNNEDTKKPCLCDGEDQVYNNKNCCYLRPKDVSIIQINDSKLFQVITKKSNLCLTSIPVEINTDGYTIESSVIDRPNDTLVIRDNGLYSFYFSFKYSFRFNENMINKDTCNINFVVKGNDREIFSIENTVNRPIMIKDESREMVNTLQGKRLLTVNEDGDFKINIALKYFDFDIATLEQILISDVLVLIEKIV